MSSSLEAYPNSRLARRSRPRGHPRPEGRERRRCARQCPPPRHRPPRQGPPRHAGRGRSCWSCPRFYWTSVRTNSPRRSLWKRKPLCRNGIHSIAQRPLTPARDARIPFSERPTHALPARSLHVICVSSVDRRHLSGSSRVGTPTRHPRHRRLRQPVIHGDLAPSDRHRDGLGRVDVHEQAVRTPLLVHRQLPPTVARIHDEVGGNAGQRAVPTLSRRDPAPPTKARPPQPQGERRAERSVWPERPPQPAPADDLRQQPVVAPSPAPR